MSPGLVLVIILVLFMLGGFSGRFGGYGYGYGNRGMGFIAALLAILLVIVFAGVL